MPERALSYDDTMHASQPIDQSTFRQAMGRFASGITVVTADTANPVGMTCQSFFSVSLEPLLVAIAVGRNSSTYPAFRQNGAFCINVLSSEQEWISTQFAMKDCDRWHGVRWTESGLGNPVLSGSLLWIDCHLEAEYDAGDHVIALGRVYDLGLSEESQSPLLYYFGRYAGISPHNSSNREGGA